MLLWRGKATWVRSPSLCHAFWPNSPLRPARLPVAGVNDNTVTVRSHLGNILKAGDAVLGYDMTSLVIPADEMADARCESWPASLPVRLPGPHRRPAAPTMSRSRTWC